MMKEWKAIVKANIYHCHDWGCFDSQLFIILFFYLPCGDPYGQVSDLPVAVVTRINQLYNGTKNGNRKRHGVQFEGTMTHLIFIL